VLDYIEYLASLPDARIEPILGSADAYHEATWVPSYMARAYTQRISLILATDSKNVAKAYELAEEFKARVPEYRDPFDDSAMIRSIDDHKNRLGM